MRWSAVAAGLVCLMLSVPAGAMTIVRASDESLVEQAPLVVVGRVVEAGPAASGAAAREYRVDVERVLKGDVGPELTVQVPGGMGANGIGRRIYGVPTFAPGERTILFLTPGTAGDHRLLHLVQGAFRERRHEGRSLALRDMSEVTEMRIAGGALESEPAAASEQVRDFDAFAHWIGETARGRSPTPDYRVAMPAVADGADRVAAPFTLFRDPDDGTLLRWFEFDTGGSVPWYFGTGGQPGVPNGGKSDFQKALQAWNADPLTPIQLNLVGDSNLTGGLDAFDGKNVILFGDPNGELAPFGPGCSGTIGLGGVGYHPIARFFRGQTYYAVIEGDIVINDGIECLFTGNPNASKLAEQLFGHEVGHTLGIGHSCGDNKSPACSNSLLDEALMRAFIHNDARGARLNSDDLAAVRALYQQAHNQPPSNTPAAPSGLTAEAISTSEIELGWQDNSNNETAFTVEARLLAGAFVAIGTVPADSTGAIVENLTPATGYVFRVRATNAEGDSTPTNEAQASTDALPGACFPGAQTLCLAGDRFEVEVDWAVPDQSTSGQGQVVPDAASDDSGLFYFFSEANWELVVKVLAACVVNDRFWVFAGGLTNVQVEVRVIDTSTSKVRHYFNPPDTAFQPVQDVDAFATCP